MDIEVALAIFIQGTSNVLSLWFHLTFLGGLYPGSVGR